MGSIKLAESVGQGRGGSNLDLAISRDLEIFLACWLELNLATFLRGPSKAMARFTPILGETFLLFHTESYSGNIHKLKMSKMAYRKSL